MSFDKVPVLFYFDPWLLCKNLFLIIQVYFFYFREQIELKHLQIHSTKESISIFSVHSDYQANHAREIFPVTTKYLY